MKKTKNQKADKVERNIFVMSKLERVSKSVYHSSRFFLISKNLQNLHLRVVKKHAHRA